MQATALLSPITTFCLLPDPQNLALPGIPVCRQYISTLLVTKIVGKKKTTKNLKTAKRTKREEKASAKIKSDLHSTSIRDHVYLPAP